MKVQSIGSSRDAMCVGGAMTIARGRAGRAKEHQQGSCQ